jgi:hypothetical protein
MFVAVSVDMRIFKEISTVLVVAFLAVNVHPYEEPELLWTVEDLPSVADDAENGWFVATAAAKHEIPEDLIVLLEPSEHDAVQFWQRVELRADGLHEFLATDTAREASERIELVRRRPAFVDERARGDSGSAIAWRGLHRVAMLQAVDLALTGDVANSCLLLRDLIRMDVAHIASARSWISFLVALANLGDALDRADMIAQRIGAEDTSGATKTALAELARVVRGVDVPAIDLENVVVGEYLSHVEALDSIDRDDPALLDQLEVPIWSRGFYSRALTLRTINARFEYRYERATEHDTFAALGGDERSPKQDFGWWFRNPVGKLLLDASMVPWESTAMSIDRKLAELGRTRELLLARPSMLGATAQ